MGQTLVDIPLNYHCNCLLSYPRRYHKILEGENRYGQEKAHTSGGAQSPGPGQTNDMMILQTWTTGMEVNSKEEGADILYDEPTRNLTS